MLHRHSHDERARPKATNTFNANHMPRIPQTMMPSHANPLPELQSPNRTFLPLNPTKVTTRSRLQRLLLVGMMWSPVRRLFDRVAELPVRRRLRVIMMVIGRDSLISLVPEDAKGEIRERGKAEHEECGDDLREED